MRTITKENINFNKPKQPSCIMSIYHNMNDYINALEHYINTPARIVCGEGFVFCNNEWIPYGEYLSNVTRPTFQLMPKANIDGTNISPEIIVKKST